MKRILLGMSLVLIFAGTAARLYRRWREEAADRRVSILVDWSEVRDEAGRQGLTDTELLERLKNAGANALLVGASTVQDYLWDGMKFSNRALAETVHHQLEERGVVPGIKNWDRLKDLEVGFNPELLGKARQAGFHLILRVNNDPWLTKEKLFADLQEIGAVNQELGVLLNTDEVPGGPDALPTWTTFLEGQDYFQLLFEFHPAKSSLKLAYRTPRSTYRAHTIPSNELKDLQPDQQLSRWKRAVQERSCRFLLFHISPNDSLAGFLENIYSVRQYLLREGWEIAWPKPRITWSFPSLAERQLAPVAALFLAILVPVMALRVGRTGTPWMSFVQIVSLSFGGACLVAAVAGNPLTRLEIVPFRGIKLAFAGAWLGSFLSLYSWKDIKTELWQNVRRVDVIAGVVLTGVVGYLLIRSGNAGSGWKVGWEQGLRDRLEDILVARPRFKEFAVGYPLLILGLSMSPHPGRRGDGPLPMGEGQAKRGVRQGLGRLLIGLGMIGPISMINTFCHLHSPLYLAFWRSLNGIILGAVMGFILVQAVRWGVSRSEA